MPPSIHQLSQRRYFQWKAKPISDAGESCQAVAETLKFVDTDGDRNRLAMIDNKLQQVYGGALEKKEVEEFFISDDEPEKEPIEAPSMADDDRRLATHEKKQTEVFSIVDDDSQDMSKLIWESFPTWMPADLVSFETQLLQMGIEGMVDLQRACNGDVVRLQEQIELLEATGFSLEENQVDELAKLCSQCNGNQRADDKNWSLAIQKTPQRLLCDVLWKAGPTWTSTDFHRAHRKLALLGIDSLSELDVALNDLNKQLRNEGLKAFSGETVRGLRKNLHEHFGRLRKKQRSKNKKIDKAAEWLSLGSSGSEKQLRLVLWESRPAWTFRDLEVVEAKLAKIKIRDVDSLTRALKGDLNRKLRKAGEKPFNSTTIEELKNHLQVLAISPRRSSVTCLTDMD